MDGSRLTVSEARYISQGLNSDHEQEGGSDSAFEPNRGSSHRRGRRFSRRVIARAQTQVRTRSRIRDSIRASGEVVSDVITVASESESINSGHSGDNGERTSNGDFGHSDTNNDGTNTESTRYGEDEMVVQNDHEDIWDLVRATLHGPEGSNGASSSGTRQVMEDQVRQEVQNGPAQTRTALHIESTATTEKVDIAPDTASGETRDGEQNNRYCESLRRHIAAAEAAFTASYTAAKESFEVAQTSKTSLHTKAVALQQERQAVLNTQEQLRKELNMTQQRVSRLLDPDLNSCLRTAETELSGMFPDMLQVLRKLHRNMENLKAINAKLTEIRADIEKIVAAPADAFFNLPNQLGVTQLPPDE